jgi:hypothetical protein
MKNKEITAPKIFHNPPGIINTRSYEVTVKRL